MFCLRNINTYTTKSISLPNVNEKQKHTYMNDLYLFDRYDFTLITFYIICVNKNTLKIQEKTFSQRLGQTFKVCIHTSWYYTHRFLNFECFPHDKFKKRTSPPLLFIAKRTRPNGPTLSVERARFFYIRNLGHNFTIFHALKSMRTLCVRDLFHWVVTRCLFFYWVSWDSLIYKVFFFSGKNKNFRHDKKFLNSSSYYYILYWYSLVIFYAKQIKRFSKTFSNFLFQKKN